MQYITRFDLKLYKTNEFRKWIQENKRILQEEGPKGWTYLGAWMTVQGFGNYGVEMRWELDDYASLGSGLGSGAYQKMLLDFNEFVEPSRGGETYLMKSVDQIMMLPGA